MEERSKLLLMDASEQEDRLTQPWHTRNIAGSVAFSVCLASLIVILAVIAAVDTGKKTFLTPPGMKARKDYALREDDMMQLSETWDPSCVSLPVLNFEKVLYSNLGNQGPDRGNGEGYVIQARETGGGDVERLGRQVLFVINSTGGKYIPASASENRLHGAYGSFNLKSKDELDFKITFYDMKYRKLKMPAFTLTFFDLDAESDMEVKESIEIGGFEHYLVDSATHLKITPLPNGNKRFEATESGTQNDNPKNPHHLSLLQRQRAFTLFFKDVEEITGRALTADGKNRGHRRFDFVAQPTLKCGRIERIGRRDYRKFPPYPIHDLKFTPPLDKPVILHDYPQYFDQWKVKVGDTVGEGDLIATVRVDGQLRELKSPANGTVKSMQDSLQRSDRVDFRLGEMNVAIIEQQILPALKTGPRTVKACVCKKWYFLDHYKVSVGQLIKRNDILAVTKNSLGEHRTEIRAPQGGLVAGIQPLKNGQTCQKVEDLNLITIGKLVTGWPRPLETDCCPGLLGTPLGGSVGGGDIGSGVAGSGGPGSVGIGSGGAGSRGPGRMGAWVTGGAGDVANTIVFEGWKVGMGDKVKKGDIVAVVIKEGVHPLGSLGLLGSGSTSANPHRGSSAAAGMADDKEATHDHEGFQQAVEGAVEGADREVMVGDGEAATKKQVAVIAEAEGFITAMQPLKEGTMIDKDKLPIAVVGHKLRGLRQSYHEIGHFCSGTFKEWKVEIGDTVGLEQILVDMDPEPIKANAQGYVTQRQEGLKQGQKIKDVALGDMCIMIAPSLRPVQPSFDEEPVNVFAKGMKFVEWKQEAGDEVEEGDVIATVKTPEGAIIEVLAPRDGIITAVLGGVKPGNDIEKVCSTVGTNCTLAGIGPKLPPLLLKEEGTNIIAPKRVQFVEWKVRRGEPVKKGQVLLVCRNNQGYNVTVASPHGGVVVRLLRFLRVGMFLDQVLQTPTVAVISKLGNLEKNPSPGDASVDAPESHQEMFKGFTVDRGDNVHEGDTVAQVIAVEPRTKVHSGGQGGGWITENVTAPKDGIVKNLEEGLTEGALLQDVMQDPQIAIISKPYGPRPKGVTQTGVRAPEDCIFKEYLAKEYDFVHPGDPLAIVEPLNGTQFLSEVTIFSHVKGYVVNRAHLVPGQKISDQQIGQTLFVIETAIPWWITVLCVLMVIGCSICCITLIMKKPRAAGHLAKRDLRMFDADERLQYQLNYRSDKGSHPGCRLDFEDASGKTHTVWAEKRPIGIKHDQKAPIVVISFTINSYAKNALGVKPGWMLVAINEESVRDDTDFNRVGTMLEYYFSQFPVWALELEFRETLESEERTIITFEEQPIGIEFFRRSPIQVEYVTPGSPADLKGVKAHWYITRIGDADVLDKHNFHDVRTMLYEAVKPLNRKEESMHQHSGANN